MYISEARKEMIEKEEGALEIEKKFDDAEESIKYCKDRILASREEIHNLEKISERLGYIIRAYDDYHDCLKNYLNDRFDDYSVMLFADAFVYVFGIIIIVRTDILPVKILFAVFLVIATIYNIFVLNRIKKIRENVRKKLLKKYKIDVKELTLEDIDDMDMSALQNKFRCVNLMKEIDQYNFYIYWKRRKMRRQKLKDKMNKKNKSNKIDT